jgi:GntR family transcriptional regulator, N-acetylglucosamine utilization regulator
MHNVEPEGLELVRLDESNPTPLYIQLQQSIEDALERGALKTADALPGERDLAKQLGVSRVTVRKAINGLVKKGVLVQRWGSGTFIASQARIEQPLSRLSSFTDDMSARGLPSSAVLLSRSIGQASPNELMALGLSPGDLVSRVNRLRLADGVPMAIEHAVIPSRFLPDPSLVKQSLYAVLQDQGVMPSRALQRLHAVLLTEQQATLLKVPPQSPALYIERRSFTGSGEAVEFTSSYYRGDAYDFVAELTIGQSDRILTDASS